MFFLHLFMVLRLKPQVCALDDLESVGILFLSKLLIVFAF